LDGPPPEATCLACSARLVVPLGPALRGRILRLRDGCQDL